MAMDRKKYQKYDSNEMWRRCLGCSGPLRPDTAYTPESKYCIKCEQRRTEGGANAQTFPKATPLNQEILDAMKKAMAADMGIASQLLGDMKSKGKNKADAGTMTRYRVIGGPHDGDLVEADGGSYLELEVKARAHVNPIMEMLGINVMSMNEFVGSFDRPRLELYRIWEVSTPVQHKSGTRTRTRKRSAVYVHSSIKDEDVMDWLIRGYSPHEEEPNNEEEM